MEAISASSNLPEIWKTEFAAMKPLIPGISQVVAAIAIIVTGFFGEAGIGTPWWSGIVFLMSGTSLLILTLMKQTVKWERCAFITIILSTLVSILALCLYCLELALAENPFPHHGISDTRLAQHYKVVAAELGLTSFNLGMCSWIFLISGTSLLILTLMKQTVKWERCAFITIILSTLVSILAICLYCLELALAENPFPHHGISGTRLAQHYNVVAAELGLTSFNLGICSWIMSLLQTARKTLLL